MGWFEKLKEIKDRIFGTKTKMLNEKNENTNITKVDLNIPKTIEKYKINYQINPNTPESAIEQYLMALLYRRKNNDNINSQGALTDLGGLQDQKNPGKNPENEKIVLNKIRRDRRYSIQEQKSRNGEVDFYHIFKGKHGKTVNRLYLNCKRENVAVLNGNIMYAKEPTSDEYIGIDGRITKIAKSYNSLLAAALNDCYYTSISDIVAKDYYLASKT